MKTDTDLANHIGADLSESALGASGGAAKPAKPRPGTSGAARALKRPQGLASLPADLRKFLSNSSVTEIAEVLSLGKGTASRIKRGIYPHTPQKLLKRWESAKTKGDVLVGEWSLRRVLPSAAAHASVLLDGEFYSGAGLAGLVNRQVAVARTSAGGLVAQTLMHAWGDKVERFPLVLLEA